MNTTPLTEWTGEELDAEMALYEEANATLDTPIDVPKLETDEEKAKWIEESRVTYGVPHKVTAEDIKTNPALAEDGSAEGDIVFLPLPTELSDEEKAKAEAELKAQKDAEEKEAAEKATASSSGVATAYVPPKPEEAKQLYYQGKPVVSYQNKLLNGKLYVDIVMVGTTHLLTSEEFAKEVSEEK